MEIWTIWISFITDSIQFITHQFSLSEAIAIIAFTLFARLILLPISLKSSFQMLKNKQAIEKLKPELDRLKEVYCDNPRELAKRTMAAYKKHGIRFFDRTTLINIGSQGILGLGVFHALKSMVFDSKFIWIANIAKPDIVLSVIVGVLTFVSMLMMPGAAEQQSYLIYLVPAMISIFVLISFPSALGLYWATSNVVSMAQALILHGAIKVSGSDKR